jgi:hypothetical protein
MTTSPLAVATAVDVAIRAGLVDWNWAGAAQGFQHALALDPSAWIAHDWYALGEL